MSNCTVNSWFSRAYGIGLLLYPLVAHLSVYIQKPESVIGYVAVLVAFSALTHIKRPVLFAGLAAIALVLAGWLMLGESQILEYWIYIPPVLIPLWLAMLFIHSLQGEDGAVITRIAELIEREKLDLRRLKYTRVVTAVWGVILLLMAVEAIVLALFAPLDVWSWWVHIGNYVLIAVLFIIEMIARWVLFNRGPQLGEMVRVMAKRPWRIGNDL